MLEAPWRWPDVGYFFMPCGYGAGKSFTIVMLVLKLAKSYYTQPINVILASTTISLLKKTVVADLEKVLNTAKIPYKYDQNSNIISIGAARFFLIPSEQPSLIYGLNVSASIVDELDELPIDKGIELVTAITERTRVMFPRGRKPFSVWPTTAQGLKSLYSVVTDFKERGIPHVIIRGHTKDNLVNSPDYVKRLYSLYSENEAKAFLEGQFVNLNSGRVYSEYDDTYCDVSKRIDIESGEEVYVGQDLNIGYSKAVAGVIRDGTLVIVKDFSFKNFGDAPRFLRQHFPTQEIHWIPDASTKEVMAGLAKEVKQYNIKVKMAYVNPSITERNFLVNKMFKMGRMKLVTPDTKELSMALKIRQFDESGKPAKGRGPKAPDHIAEALEYLVFRIVGFRSEFRDLWELAKPLRGNRTGEASLRTRGNDEVFTNTED